MIELICVGKARCALADAAALYEDRLAKQCELAVRVVREERLDAMGAAEAMRREAVRIEPLLEGRFVVALDRSGKAYASEQLAEFVQEREERAPQKTVFLIGGPSGIDAELLARCDGRWTLGAGTLPHQLARVVVGEQLYRAFTILRREPYHR